jgi:hypothetical protein
MLCPSTRSFGVGLLRSAQSSGRYSHEVVARAELSDATLSYSRTDRLPIENGFVQNGPDGSIDLSTFTKLPKSMARP